MSVAYSCVVGDERFVYPAMLWAVSLITYGGQAADSLLVHIADECEAQSRVAFESLGVRTRMVKPFDARHPHSNKLCQVESELLQSVDYAVLCDCDIAFCETIESVVNGESLRARIVGSANLSLEQWEEIFRRAGLPLPAGRARAAFDGRETLSTYCNGGLLIIPQPIYRDLRPVWPRWDRWLLDRPELLAPFGFFTDQVSLTLSCAELGIGIEHLPVEFNCPTQSENSALEAIKTPPRVLHYHDRVTADGLLQTTPFPVLNRQIDKVNRLIESNRGRAFKNIWSRRLSGPARNAG